MTEILYNRICQETSDTEALGRALAEDILKSNKEQVHIAMYGDLGAGKTSFVRGLASLISPTAKVHSPTYTIVNEYLGGTMPIFHFDMYRISDEDDLYSIGYWDYTEKNGIIVTEWSENTEFILPQAYYSVRIAYCEQGRHIEISYTECKE
jgi:tRNA threonylcarbamoyladenosine biosynthesis protein TsaE